MEKNQKKHLEVITENAIDVISKEELIQKITLSLREKKPLKVKIGFDPTTCDIHLGHTVLLRKLREIQRLGHIVYFIIGDFTAQIGDPSGRNELRPLLSAKEIENNAKTYTKQAFKILDRDKTHVIFNSRWYKDMRVSYFISLLSRYTVARMIERDDFSKRLRERKPLTLQEFIYPIIQGYDSVKIKADIEFGGVDQKFNLIIARHLQESFRQIPQVVITLPLLVGLDGKNKMSKSLGNYIGITEDAKNMFGKIMSISDELMWEYFRLLTTIDIEKVKKMHPKEAKLLLAETIVGYYHSPLFAEKERKRFEKVFFQKEIPDDLEEYIVYSKKIDIVDILYRSGYVCSKREARRLIEQKSIWCEGKPLFSSCFTLPSSNVVLKVGKKRFLKIVYRPS